MSLESYRFPLFVDLSGRKTVVVGGGKIAGRRIGILKSFGADVIVISPENEQFPEGVVHKKRCYEEGDLEGAFLAVAATDDREVNRRVGLEAARRGIFVSVADRKEESTFYFPAICTGSGIIAGVVSEGEAHKKTARAARAVREVLEDIE